MSDSEWCPSMSGNCSGWAPEYYDYDRNEWRPIPVSQSKQWGVPHPSFNGGVLLALGMYGEHQALALAHMYAAGQEADWRTGWPTVRVQKYEVVFDLKARKVADKEQNADAAQEGK